MENIWEISEKSSIDLEYTWEDMGKSSIDLEKRMKKVWEKIWITH